MAPVLEVLDVAGGAVCFVFRDEHAISAGFYPSVMTGGASSPRRIEIDGIERLVAARTRYLTLCVARNSGNSAYAAQMNGMKLFTAPMILGISG